MGLPPIRRIKQNRPVPDLAQGGCFVVKGKVEPPFVLDIS